MSGSTHPQNPYHNGGRPQGGGAGPRPNPHNVPIPWPITFPISYEGFTIRKAPSTEAGTKANWSRVVSTPVTVTPRLFASEQRAIKNVSVTKLYDALRTPAQREAVDRVLDDQRRAEPNPHATWDFGLIKPKITTIPGTLGRATETVYITVFLKRQPRTNTGVNTSPLNKYGRIIDTSHPSLNFPTYPVINHLEPPPLQQLPQAPQLPPQVTRLPGPPPDHLPPPPPLPPNAGRPNNQSQGIPHNQSQGNPNMQGQGNPNMQSQGNPNMQRQGNPNMQNHGNPNMQRQSNSILQNHGNPQRQTKSAEHPRNSLEFSRKVEEWKVEANSDDSDTDSDDDSEIVAIVDKKSKNVKDFKLPKPPMGQYASGALPPRRSQSRSPPILKHKVSKTKIEKSRHGKEQKTVRRLSETRYASDGSDPLSDSWDRLDDLSSGSSRKSRSTRATSYTSSSDDKYYQRERNHSRSRHRKRSRSRSRHRDSHRHAYRKHRKPSPYRGLSDRESDRGVRSQAPIIVHEHIYNREPAMASRPAHAEPYRDSSPTSIASLYSNPFLAQRRLNYPNPDDDMFAMSAMQRTLPTVPMAQDYSRPVHSLRQKTTALEEYIRSQERRNTFSQSQILDAYRRVEDEAREKRRLEDAVQHTLDLERREREKTQRLNDTLRQKERQKDELVQRLREEREREAYASRPYERERSRDVGDRYKSTSCGNMNDTGYATRNDRRNDHAHATSKYDVRFSRNTVMI